jgi:cob(I)alamin adenosyltransferase
MKNRLTQIYTKTGDAGKTSLANGKKLSKTEMIFDAIGTIDELNSTLGIIIAFSKDKKINKIVLEVQNNLFNIGGELALQDKMLIHQSQVKDLEKLIDFFNKDLPPLKEFILPGGSKEASFCHLARTICRRSERHLFMLHKKNSINPETLSYINRLSDFLFVVARIFNKKNGKDDIFWQI